MARSGGSPFKVYERTQRNLTSESLYSGGMSFVETPLPMGVVRLLVNYEVTNEGTTLRPRGGYQPLQDIVVDADNSNMQIHHIGEMYVEFPDDNDAQTRRYILIGTPGGGNLGIYTTESVLLIENPSTGELTPAVLYDPPSVNHMIRQNSNSNTGLIHGVLPSNPGPTPIHTTMHNTAYMMYQDLTTTGLTRLYCKFQGGTYQYTFINIEPEAITPAQAVNYGYNILASDPYTFTNTQGTTLRLMGILPYDDEGNLKFSANVNEEVNFKLIYEYPAAAPNYKVQWELHDISSEAYEVLQKVADSPEYTAPNEISIVVRSPYKKFSLIAKVYDVADITEPIKSMQLGSYYLTDDSSQNVRDVDLTDYQLGTAKGMLAWQGRMVLWGVHQAKPVLFLSAVNNPGYFPFPHGIEEFDYDILDVKIYQGQLLVFTNSTLYLCAWDPTGLMLTKKVVQGNLNITPYDATTIQIVKNLVYFKSNNYYYMVVPNVKSIDTGALIIAPVSRPVEPLLDDLHTHVATILDDSYNIGYTLDIRNNPWTLELLDMYTFLDVSQVRNCYVYKLTHESGIIYLEFRLNYDTLLRIWTVSIVETNGRRMKSYRQNITENSVYSNLYVDGTATKLQLLSRNQLDPSDTASLDNNKVREIKNYQALDTGKRDQATSYKKRFRELQFRVNNLSQEDLEFYTEFHIDDDVRKSLFQYQTQHITDPNDINYGLVYVERSYADPELVHGVTKLGSWKLGLSQFPDVSVVKVRMPVSGKGYAGRLKLISINEAMYELLSNTWVYRMMNAR